MSAQPAIRDRLVRGAQAQVFGHAVRVVVQVGSVSILLALWGLSKYGDWLLLAALPTYLSFSDLGFFTAAQNDMIMATGRNDRPAALLVFQVVSHAMLFVVAAFVVVLPAAALVIPVADLLNLSVIADDTARATVVALGLNMLVTLYAAIIYGGFACVGRYGEGGFAVAALSLVEFAGLAAGAVIAGPLAAAIGMLVTRTGGTVAMYVAMRRHAPWLRFGRPGGTRPVLRRLLAPALAAGAFPVAFALNLQGMLLLVGLTAGPAAAAVFSTLRTLSRVVFQMIASIFALVAPEISKAYAEDDHALLRNLHRRACQTAVWIAVPTLVALAVLGPEIIDLWTSGKVDPSYTLLLLFLLVSGIDSLWYTSMVVMVATNRHQQIAWIYMGASLGILAVAYPLLQAWGLEGGALSLILLELFMLFVGLRRTLPAAHDSLGPWLGGVLRPPVFIARMLRPRAQGS